MTVEQQYPYARGALLTERNIYSYSPFHGAPFLLAWADQRASARIESTRGRTLNLAETPTLEMVRSIKGKLEGTTRDSEAWHTLDRLVQRFEVTKRVHHEYSEAWRAVDKDQFSALPAYIELAEAFSMAFRQTKQLTYLNVLLKLIDTLSTFLGDLPDDLVARGQRLIDDEADFVDSLKTSANTQSDPHCNDVPGMQTARVNADRAVFLACSSARSRAYLEALCHYGLTPGRVLIMGEDNDAPPVPGHCSSIWKGLFLPDMHRSLSEICAANSIPVTHLQDRNVNAPETLAAVSNLDADVVVYSGVGGQIVSDKVLSSGPPFLHMHSGWLPDYRGSTTFYYAILNKELPAVSAILLDPGIDTGPILKRQSYPTPSSEMNVDLVYDPAIRADLLCRALPEYLQQTPSDPEFIQKPEVGITYYEIHPVLKHIALLSLSGETS